MGWREEMGKLHSAETPLGISNLNAESETQSILPEILEDKNSLHFLPEGVDARIPRWAVGVDGEGKCWLNLDHDFVIGCHPTGTHDLGVCRQGDRYFVSPDINNPRHRWTRNSVMSKGDNVPVVMLLSRDEHP